MQLTLSALVASLFFLDAISGTDGAKSRHHDNHQCSGSRHDANFVVSDCTKPSAAAIKCDKLFGIMTTLGFGVFSVRLDVALI